MKRNRHILTKWLLGVLLSMWVLPISANDAEMSGLHCGDVVTITATPDAGYRFVRWSDGNTDNPREIEISQMVELAAVYEPICKTDLVPIVWLYDRLMMVNVDSLLRMGYVFSEQSVTWYRIVGDTDAGAEEREDQVLGSGYFYNLADNQMGLFYAAVDVSGTPPTSPPRCSDILYSLPIRRGRTGLEDIEDDIGVGKVRKIILDNRLYILRGNQMYRADGSKVSE